MSKHDVKSLKEYEEESIFDQKSLLEAMKKAKQKRSPTSVALEETTIKELKKIGAKIGVPYQVLMRMFINEGLDRMKKASAI